MEMEQVSWPVIEVIQIRNDDDMDQSGRTGMAALTVIEYGQIWKMFQGLSQ